MKIIEEFDSELMSIHIDLKLILTTKLRQSKRIITIISIS